MKRRAPVAIERNGIDTIHESERKGAPRQLFLPWFASNVTVFGISYGAFARANDRDRAPNRRRRRRR